MSTARARIRARARQRWTQPSEHMLNQFAQWEANYVTWEEDLRANWLAARADEVAPIVWEGIAA